MIATFSAYLAAVIVEVAVVGSVATLAWLTWLVLRHAGRAVARKRARLVERKRRAGDMTPGDGGSVI